MITPADSLKYGLSQVHESEQHSDCTIVCGPYHFKVHKVILAIQSKYFKTAFKNGTFKEGKNGVIELKAADGDTEEFDEACDDPEIVKLMVEYFYHLDYPRPKDSTTSTKSTRQSTKKLRYSHPTWDSSGQETPPQAFDAEQPNVNLMQHAKLFAMAVKYQIDGLRHLTTQKFKEAVATQWSHEDFAHTIHIVYNSTAEDVTELREIVADAVHAHFEELQERPGVEASMRSIAALTYGLLTRSRERNRNKGYYY
ncbi:hypothetical protein WHR41_05568 [Cladosporium halotolerans]|uniref:BTB domain-containing protein n=1 Tax=Cladosporium halotolerans TaxID=1052096 RepID=A0AB34KSI9_9PEZI